eukprot:44432_1
MFHLSFKCLIKSYKISPDVPTIAINYNLNKRHLESMINLLRCDICAVKCSQCKLYPCSGCFNIYYCSKRCQKIGWTRKMHRKICGKKFMPLIREKIKRG